MTPDGILHKCDIAKSEPVCDFGVEKSSIQTVSFYDENGWKSSQTLGWEGSSRHNIIGVKVPLGTKFLLGRSHSAQNP